jgi:actin-related protein 8
MNSEVIIFHPGSLYLRIGKGSDLNPDMILNCVARKRKAKNSPVYCDSILPNSISKTNYPELSAELDEARKSISHMLQGCLQSDGKKRYGTSAQQLSAFNKRSLPEIVNGQSTFWLKPKDNVQTIVGADVLRLNPNSEFNIHFPIRKGELNIHNNVGGSMNATLSHIREIWEFAIKNYLDVSLKELCHYKAVLIIPDIYNRKRVKLLTGLLFEMGFKACILIQEHVAASIGSGLNCACVVDIGDQKISVSCVEDTISHPNTRVSLKFGGGDVTMSFFWLLQKCSFPYKECQPKNNQDAALLNHLKEQYCHIDLDICGSQEKSFIINRPDQSPVRYVLQVADELLIAPLSLFHTDLLKFTLGTSNRDKVIQIQKTLGQDFDSEDCFNAEFLRETGRRNAKDQAETTFNESNNVDAEEEEVDDFKFNANDFQTANGQIIALDSAILQSIEHLSNEDLKRKMYNCILLTGAGSKIAGLSRWLQNKIRQSTPTTYRNISENQDIVVSVKDVDAGNVTWRGAAILTSLETADELWITKEDWQNHGIRVLREKVPFIW